METKNRKGLTKQMVELKASGASYATIAKQVGVSRQRVQQYFMPKLDVTREVADRVKALCEECGQFDQFGHYHHKIYEYEVLNDPSNILYLCVRCHMRHNGQPHFCKNCGKPISSQRKYCNRECRVLYYSVPYECSYCHKTFIMNATQKIRIRLSTSGLIFCCRQCQGKYLAEHYGFAIHPEHRSRRGRKTCKYDPLMPELIMRWRSGEKLWHIMKTKNIPEGSYTWLTKCIRNRINQKNIIPDNPEIY